jgi:predicted DCC family thiol-disulfide oxidoreductase YuxK
MTDTTTQPERPRLIYDGDCAFCGLWVTHWQALTGDRIEYVPFQQVEHEYPHISHETFERGVQFVQPNGSIYRNAEAVFRLVQPVPRRGWLLTLYQHLPGFAPITEAVYAWIGRHRDFAYHATKLLWGNALGPHTFDLTRALFVRGMGIIYLIAFVSFGVQLMGLIGSGGILPAARYIERIQATYPGFERWLYYPTLAHLNSSDAFLQFLSYGGAVAAALAVLGIFSGPALIVCWLFYISLQVAGQGFMSFQWETLLLETGFLAIFLGGWWPLIRQRRPPSLLVIYLLRWLLFRLMFGSGLGKLLSGDPTWLNLTALEYHYWTQPIPNPIAWYVHQLPAWFHQFSVASMLFIELVVPFLFFAPRRLRFIGGLLTIGLQLAILTTGNYTYFNWLTIVLCIPLFDDPFFRRFVPQRLLGNPALMLAHRRHPLRRLGLALVAVVVLFTTGVRFGTRLASRNLTEDLPAPLAEAVNISYRLRIAGGYGLFTTMTTRRPEIIVEGSNDGETWLAYTFPYKPGDLRRPPPFVAPHQPRLDWQMWFAALGGSYRNADWTTAFARRLLDGKPDVLALLETNPFPDAPPRYIRMQIMDYGFTDAATRAQTGYWWTRGSAREFLPVVSLESYGG